MRARTLVLAVGLVTATTAASAAEKTPIAALKESPAPATDVSAAKPVDAIAGFTLEARPPSTRQLLIGKAATKQGYCLVGFENQLRMSESSYEPGQRGEELWRLVTKDDKTTLERTTFTVDQATRALAVVRRTSVELREVARTPEGVVAWGFRSGAEVFLVATGAYSGLEAIKKTDDSEVLPFMSSDCTFGAVRLDARKAEAGVAGQLSGSLASEGKEGPTFIVDASIGRVGRDREARLAVRVRVARR